MNKIIGIYKITSPSGKIYIGQAIDIKRRWRQYKRLECKNQNKLYNSLKHYGVENHKFEIIKECDISELSYYERHYQEYYDVLGEYGLNLSYVGIGEKKQIVSDATKEKLRIANLGKKMSDESREKMSNAKKNISLETRKKMSDAKKGKPSLIKGKKHSDERKRKNSEAQKGRQQSEETRKKRSESMKGRICSSETRLKISEKLKGRETSDEFRQNCSDAQKKLYESGYVNPMAKKVINTETNDIYNSVAEMSRILGLNPKTMINRLSGHRKNNTPFRYL
jgi:group I intron endonuclease